MFASFPTRLGSALFVLLALVASAPAVAQHAVSVRVTDEHSGAPLPGATVVADLTPPVGASTGPDGVARLADLPAGDRTLTISFVGYEPATVRVTLPRADDALVEVA